jgi:hypothetical protein
VGPFIGQFHIHFGEFEWKYLESKRDRGVHVISCDTGHNSVTFRRWYKRDRTMKEEAIQLIIVCCHGIWLGGPSLGDDETEWLIALFQHGETPTFAEHIKAGFRLLSSTPDSLLVFSGYPPPLSPYD